MEKIQPRLERCKRQKREKRKEKGKKKNKQKKKTNILLPFLVGWKGDSPTQGRNQYMLWQRGQIPAPSLPQSAPCSEDALTVRLQIIQVFQPRARCWVWIPAPSPLRPLPGIQLQLSVQPKSLFLGWAEVGDVWLADPTLGWKDIPAFSAPQHRRQQSRWPGLDNHKQSPKFISLMEP